MIIYVYEPIKRKRGLGKGGGERQEEKELREKGYTSSPNELNGELLSSPTRLLGNQSYRTAMFVFAELGWTAVSVHITHLVLVQAVSLSVLLFLAANLTFFQEPGGLGSPPSFPVSPDIMPLHEATYSLHSDKY